MRTRYLIVTILLASVTATPALAFTGPGEGNRPEIRGPQGQPEIRGLRQAPAGPDQERTLEVRKEIEAEIREHRLMNASFTARLKAEGADAAQLFKERRQEVVADIQQKREDWQDRIKAERERLKAVVETRKAELKAKVEAFKDRGKGEIVQRLDAAFDAINGKWIAFFTASVNRIENVLDAIASRTDKAEAAGKDVTAVRARIEAATDAIASARAAIEAQAGKDYTLRIGSEETAKADVAGIRKQLGDDLQAVRAAVRAAFDATKAAAEALKAIPGVADVELEAAATTQ